MTALLDLEGALDALARAQVMGVPTDTVYGLAASLAHRDAVRSLFTLKGRPASVALPVVVDSVSQIEQLGVTWPPSASRLSAAFWPGALTIVVAVPVGLSTLVGGNTGTVGFRIPNDELLRALLRRSGALALTSANEHGTSPCQSALQVLDAFEHKGLGGVLDGGQCSGTVSTVVDLSGTDWRVVREGAIGAPELAAVLA